jgi:hypothetical protein
MEKELSMTYIHEAMPPAVDPPRKPDWPATAHHEAAHAVVALLLGRQVLHVYLPDEPDGIPMTVIAVNLNDPLQCRLHPAKASLLFGLAGRHGEGLIGPTPRLEDVEFNHERIHTTYTEFESELGETLEQIDAEAVWLVRRYRPQVEKVAQALLECRHLSGAEIQQVLGKPLIPPSPYIPPYAMR